MPISALSFKFYNIRYFSFSFEKKYYFVILFSFHLDQNLLPAYMSSIFSVFIDLLVYSKCQIKIKKNSGQFWTGSCAKSLQTMALVVLLQLI